MTRFDGVKVELDAEAMPRYAPGPDAEYFVLWTSHAGGWRVLQQSESLRPFTWEWSQQPPQPIGIADVLLPSGLGGRALVAEFEPARESDDPTEPAAPPLETPIPLVRLFVAANRAPLDRSLNAISWSIFAVGLSMAVAGVAAAAWAVGRGLTPLRALSSQVADLGPRKLDARFQIAGLPAELRPIADQLDGLLARMREAFEREKRFSTAASHELRTPIAELRVLLDVASSRERTTEEWSITASTALGVLDRAEELSRALLRLARADATSPNPDPDRADVANLLRQQAASVTSAHGIEPDRIRIECPDSLIARADPAIVGSILAGLLDNAVRHGGSSLAAQVVVRAFVQPPSEREARGHDPSARWVHVEFTNAAPDLRTDDLPKLFEPFWRRDPSRSGFGLGLAVVRSLAQSQSGRVSAELRPPHGLCIRLELPGA